MEVIAWIGSVALAFCALPQAIFCLKTKSARGLDWGFLLLWALGELCMVIYSAHLRSLPLFLNYGVNGVLLGIIVYFKVIDENT